MISHKGSYRKVFLIGRLAIKVAWGHDHRAFLYGCYSNKSERMHCQHWKKQDPESLKYVARFIDARGTVYRFALYSILDLTLVKNP